MYRWMFVAAAVGAVVVVVLAHRHYRHVDMLLPAAVVCFVSGLAAAFAPPRSVLEFVLAAVMAAAALTCMFLMRRAYPRNRP